MAKCDFCGTETRLYRCGVPICVKCVEAPKPRKKLPVKEGTTEERKSETPLKSGAQWR
jgi:hypothetical protein